MFPPVEGLALRAFNHSHIQQYSDLKSEDRRLPSGEYSRMQRRGSQPWMKARGAYLNPAAKSMCLYKIQDLKNFVSHDQSAPVNCALRGHFIVCLSLIGCEYSQRQATKVQSGWPTQNRQRHCGWWTVTSEWNHTPKRPTLRLPTTRKTYRPTLRRLYRPQLTSTPY